MEQYDYTDMRNSDLVFADMDMLNRSQLEAVSEFVMELKKRGEHEAHNQFGQWFDAALLPVFKNFAALTYSVLEISRTPVDITAAFRNPRGVDFSDECRSMKTAFCMAGHVYLQKEGDDVVLGMVFNPEQFRG